MASLKILYISPEHTVGALSLWKMGHESRGNICRYVTFFRNPHDFPEDICLNLPLIAAKPWYINLRNLIYHLFGTVSKEKTNNDASSPFWTPNAAEALYFKFRDVLWKPKIDKAIEQYGLGEFDIYHFEWGLDFFRDARFMRKIYSQGKKIVCTYHGQDIRDRGVLPEVDKLSHLNLTSELDLLDIYPKLNYLFLPYDTSQDDYRIMQKVESPVRVCHSPTNRYFKGSDFIIKITQKVCREEGAEFVLIENRPHEEVMHIKSTCHIFIDQIANRGGWGYGMNSVEAMSLGLCCLTNLIARYEEFIPDHPFINISYDNYESTLRKLLRQPGRILEQGQLARKWVVKHHDIHAVMEQLYRYYLKAGVIKEL